MMRNFFKSFLSTLLALTMIITLAAVPSSAATIKLNYSSFKLTKGYSATLKVSGTSSTPAWSTGDKSVATVSSKGKVVGKGIGSTYIYAKVAGKTLKCKVNVVAGKITVNNDDVTIDKGESIKVKVKALGTHTISVKSSDKNVVKASWNGAKFDGNYIYLTLKGVNDGTARIKVYAKNYSDTVYKYIDVTVGDGDVIVDDGHDNSQLTASATSVKVEQGKTISFNVYYKDASKLRAYSTNTDIALITLNPNGNGVAAATVAGVKNGTANLIVYVSGDVSNQISIPVNVGGDNAGEYYKVYDKAPEKKTDTDKVLQFKSGNTEKYMLLPADYDMANVNQLIAEYMNTYQYYTLYTKNPLKKAATDTVSSVNIIYRGAVVVRYVLLPAGYDEAKVNDLAADYSGMFEYYRIYTKNPTKMVLTDVVLTWKISTYDAASGRYVETNRYMLVPYNYDVLKANTIMENDKGSTAAVTGESYIVLNEFPSSYDKQKYEVFSWKNSRDNKVKYMLVPLKDCNFVKRNDAIYNDTGVYCYYNAYSTKPVISDPKTEEVVTMKLQVPGETKLITVYILINPSDSAAVRQAGINDAISGVYCTIPQK